MPRKGPRVRLPLLPLMDKEDYWVEKAKGDWWCVYHISMEEKPIVCFPKKKQAVAFIEKQIEKHWPKAEGRIRGIYERLVADEK